MGFPKEEGDHPMSEREWDRARDTFEPQSDLTARAHPCMNEAQ